jgi:hypothetical protein
MNMRYRSKYYLYRMCEQKLKSNKLTGRLVLPLGRCMVAQQCRVGRTSNGAGGANGSVHVLLKAGDSPAKLLLALLLHLILQVDLKELVRDPSDVRLSR